MSSSENRNRLGLSATAQLVDCLRNGNGSYNQCFCITFPGDADCRDPTLSPAASTTPPLTAVTPIVLRPPNSTASPDRSVKNQGLGIIIGVASLPLAVFLVLMFFVLAKRRASQRNQERQQQRQDEQQYQQHSSDGGVTESLAEFSRGETADVTELEWEDDRPPSYIQAARQGPNLPTYSQACLNRAGRRQPTPVTSEDHQPSAPPAGQGAELNSSVTEMRVPSVGEGRDDGAGGTAV